MKTFRRSRIAVAALTIGGLSLATFVATRAGAAGETKSYAAGLVGSNEVPVAPATSAGDPDGTGSATATINSTTNEFCWDITTTGLSTITAAHLHNGAAGANGGVVIDFEGVLDGCDTIAAPLAADIVAKPDTYYFNIHSSEHPNGAIRGQLSAQANGPQTFFSLSSPIRAYDSRKPGDKKMAASETRTIALVQGRNAAGVALPAVPVGAFAAQVVITVTGTSAAGYLSAHAAGTPVPEASVINWFAENSDLATGTVVPLDATGRIALTAGPTSTTNVIVDVIGYYIADEGSTLPGPTSTTVAPVPGPSDAPPPDMSTPMPTSSMATATSG
jgi:hypothetical protein